LIEEEEGDAKQSDAAAMETDKKEGGGVPAEGPPPAPDAEEPGTAADAAPKVKCPCLPLRKKETGKQKQTKTNKKEEEKQQCSPKLKS